ncbi:helix-turn-helix domain-containing protein [Vibrio jasicida]|uniref:helix-turn-helix domain-containing protein n=1 Tax=Vibrio jasicida TaxID=766224 RepID=UPI000CE559FD|nr:helix-turn-helix domain-containing protein [Vibrio jasicida]
MKSNFSHHLRMTRKRRGWSQRELVERLHDLSFSLFSGLDVNALSRWESEKIQPTPERMVQIFRALRISVDELKVCGFPKKPQLMKRFERFRRGNFGLIELPQRQGAWRRLKEKGSGYKFLRSLCSVEEYEPFVTGRERTEQWSVTGCYLASVTYRIEGDTFILLHSESLTYSALLSTIERLIELLYESEAKFFWIVAAERKAAKKARVLQLEEVGLCSNIYSGTSDYVLGELLTIRTWSSSNNT